MGPIALSPAPVEPRTGAGDGAVLRQSIIPSTRAAYNIPHRHGLLLLATRNDLVIQSSFHENAQSPSLCSDHIEYSSLARVASEPPPTNHRPVIALHRSLSRALS